MEKMPVIMVIYFASHFPRAGHGSEDRRQRTEDRGQRTKDRGQPDLAGKAADAEITDTAFACG